MVQQALNLGLRCCFDFSFTWIVELSLLCVAFNPGQERKTCLLQVFYSDLAYIVFVTSHYIVYGCLEFFVFTLFISPFSVFGT